MQQHLTTHKQKYISFLVVAILVFLVSYAARDTEALGQQEEQVMMAQSGRRCPPRLLHMVDAIRFFHPCMREFLHFDPVPAPQPQPEPQVVPQATSTTETATSTDATSTLEMATSTEAATPETASSTKEAAEPVSSEIRENISAEITTDTSSEAGE
jgi:hypothetical protein